VDPIEWFPVAFIFSRLGSDRSPVPADGSVSGKGVGLAALVFDSSDGGVPGIEDDTLG
jgi:hypothetical protein